MIELSHFPTGSAEGFQLPHTLAHTFALGAHVFASDKGYEVEQTTSSHSSFNNSPGFGRHTFSISWASPQLRVVDYL